MKVEYKASVSTGAGWREVYMIANVEKISEKRVKVLDVISIDDEPVSRNMSRTGAKRQQFNGQYFAYQEIGKVKNISSLFKIIEG